jgi:hypothetical protein
MEIRYSSMVSTSFGFIPDCELKTVLFPANPAIPVPLPAGIMGPTSLTPKLAYFVGYFFGDGGLKDVERSFRVSGRREHKMIIADEYEIQIQLMQSLYFDLFGRLPPIRYERLNKGERMVYLNPTDKQTYCFLTSIFELPSGPKTTSLHIPQVIQVAPIELRQWFLRGLFDAEGDTRATEKGLISSPRVKIRMKCIPFISQVKDLFETSFQIPMNGPYLDTANASAYVQVDRFSHIIRLSENTLFLHPIKRWRLEKLADFLRTRTRFFKDSPTKSLRNGQVAQPDMVSLVFCDKTL